ncbi:MAG: hypothetical protein JJU36_11700 [Phycisphaeraceae bacterium]|nr:hypothetical protein [Phycisphaeraceae bacterium]
MSSAPSREPTKASFPPAVEAVAEPSPIQRVLLEARPFAQQEAVDRWVEQGRWPCYWLMPPSPNAHLDRPDTGNQRPDHPTSRTGGIRGQPITWLCRLRFGLRESETVRFHVSADERYRLWVDGRPVGRGPERGEPAHWHFESYQGALEAGPHEILAMVWSWGSSVPFAQMSMSPGFLLAAEEPWLERIATGHAAWEATIVPGIEPGEQKIGWGVGARVRFDARLLDWSDQGLEALAWRPAARGKQAFSDTNREGMEMPLLTPARLPAPVSAGFDPGRVRHARSIDETGQTHEPIDPTLHDEAEARRWQAMLDHGQPVTIPARQGRCVLIDLDNYACVYPAIGVRGGGGAEVRFSMAEALYCQEHPSREKGDRDKIDGRYYRADEDVLIAGDGNRVLFTPWWSSGRYARIVVLAADEPLTIERISLEETRYPLERDFGFTCDEPRFEPASRIMFRTLQMCAHETYMDCPYYEQLMYIGDTRLEALVTLISTGDDALVRKAIELFDFSRLPEGFCQSRYPSNRRQVIPPFSLWWIGMLHDYAHLRDDAAFVRRHMRGVRAILDAFLACRNGDGLIEAPTGWNFMDWVDRPHWKHGVPPDGEHGISGPIHWQLILALEYARQLERYVGEPEPAARWLRCADELTEVAWSCFWDEASGQLCDDQERRFASEHSHSMAILGGRLDVDRQRLVAATLVESKNLDPATIYFSHYVLDVLAKLGRMDLIFARLESWLTLTERGFRTAPEKPEPSRSDCHAWSAHPLYHFAASIMGIRPEGPGFAGVRIQPQPWKLRKLEASMPHPRGVIRSHLEQVDNHWHARVELPETVTGQFIWRGRTHPLKPGRQELVLKTS